MNTINNTTLTTAATTTTTGSSSIKGMCALWNVPCYNPVDVDMDIDVCMLWIMSRIGVKRKRTREMGDRRSGKEWLVTKRGNNAQWFAWNNITDNKVRNYWNADRENCNSRITARCHWIINLRIHSAQLWYFYYHIRTRIEEWLRMASAINSFIPSYLMSLAHMRAKMKWNEQIQYGTIDIDRWRGSDCDATISKHSQKIAQTIANLWWKVQPINRWNSHRNYILYKWHQHLSHLMCFVSYVVNELNSYVCNP